MPKHVPHIFAIKRRTNNRHRRKEYIKNQRYTVQQDVAKSISELDVNSWVSTIDQGIKSGPATLSNGSLSVCHYSDKTY
jgi:hypothetical protein